MADDGVPRARRHRVRVVLNATGALALVAASGVAAQSLLSLQHSYQGTTGGRVAHLLAAGSTWGTSWPGWLAALFFGIAVLRVRRGAPEPPAGVTPLEAMSLPQLHRGLLREYAVVRAALVVLSLVALVDAARAVRYILASASGDTVARATLPPLLVEAAGLVAAAVVLTVWALSFRTQLQRLGALR